MDLPTFPEFEPTLGNVIEHAARTFGDRVFLAADDVHVTFSEFDQLSRHLAKGLLARGVGKATRVAVLMGNSPDWVMAWCAAGRMGALAIPLSTLMQPRELAWILRFADVDTLLMQGQFGGVDLVGRLERAIPGLARTTGPMLALDSHPFLRQVVIWGSEQPPRWARRGPEDLVTEAPDVRPVDDVMARAAEANVVPSDLLVGICTSGTTAEPKLVLHTHGAVVRMTRAYVEYRTDVTKDTRDLATMPLFWVGGLNGHLFPSLHRGACMVFSRTPEVHDLVDTIRREGANRLNLFPARLRTVLDAAAKEGLDLTAAAGVRVPQLPDGTPAPLNRRGSNMLGMTETFGPHGFADATSVLPEDKAGSAGRSLQGIERRIVDPQTGTELPNGSIGMLEIRGMSMMDGYYKRERRDVFSSDGWFGAGDMCSIDEDGYLYFHSRVSEMIKSAGANVAPREVEDVLAEQPGVREAIVFGVPDPRRGEAVMAVVVPVEGVDLDTEQLLASIRLELSAYKVPSVLCLRRYDEVPRTHLGKPKKAELRAHVVAELAKGSGREE